MKPSKNQKANALRTEVSNFLTRWHNDFILDYWWRKKHDVAFGSAAHREMNFIDMFIEYQEEVIIKRAQLNEQRKEIGLEKKGLKTWFRCLSKRLMTIMKI